MAIPPEFVATPMVRSARAAEVGVRRTTPRGGRRPRNVPLYVDNLWEWARPDGLPSRRRSAFASPSARLAARYGPANGVVCRVLLCPPFRAVQVAGYGDASQHPDVAGLRAVVEDLGPPEAGLDDLRHRLLPDAAAVEHVLVTLDPIFREAVSRRVTLWSDTVPVTGFDDTTDSIGEYFFEAPEGYLLVPLD